MAKFEQAPSRHKTCWEVICEEFACNHEEMELRLKINSAGQRCFVSQCLRCGFDEQIARAKLSKEQIEQASIVPFDRPLRKSWTDRRHLEYEKRCNDYYNNVVPQKSAVWWEWYNRYLASPQWQEKRRKVLGRCKGICEGCGKRPAHHIHHLTYDRVGDEMLFDLVAVCLDCHRRIHPDKELA